MDYETRVARLRVLNQRRMSTLDKLYDETWSHPNAQVRLRTELSEIEHEIATLNA